jgi:hypothetical protein
MYLFSASANPHGYRLFLTNLTRLICNTCLNQINGVKSRFFEAKNDIWYGLTRIADSSRRLYGRRDESAILVFYF